MKKKLLLILPISMILCGCKLNLFGKTIYLFEKNPEEQKDKEDEQFDDYIPEEINQHAVNLSKDPSAPFYINVGEQRSIKVEYPSGSKPDNANERIFEWTYTSGSAQNLKFELDKTTTEKAVVTGLKEGEVKLTATNTYNKNLKVTFNIKVLDYDYNYDYLWQYDSADRKQFGYDTNNAKKGTLSGEAILNDMTWSYTRSNLGSLQSSMGAIGFGKGPDSTTHIPSPETHVHLEAENDKLVDKIVIETASANSLAKMSFKVGETKVFDQVTCPKAVDNTLTTISSESGLNLNGKFELDFETPEYDPSRVGDDSYLMPGAVYLKSILIYYVAKPIQRIEIDAESAHKTAYISNKNIILNGMKLNKITTDNESIPVEVEHAINAGRITTDIKNSGEASETPKEITALLSLKGYDEPFEVKFEIIVQNGFNLSRIKSLSDLNDEEQYYVVCPEDHLFFKGSNAKSNLTGGKSANIDKTIDFVDDIELFTSWQGEHVSIKKGENDKFALLTQRGYYLGIKPDGTGAFETEENLGTKDLSFVMDSNGLIKVSCTFEKEDETTSTYYFGGNSTHTGFGVTKGERAPIAIYRAVE